MPCVAHPAARLGPLVPAVRGHDGGKVRASGLDVVVVAVHASLGQAMGLVLGEDAGADGDVESRLVPDEWDEVEEARDGALVGTADGEDEAELRCAESGGLTGGGEDLARIEKRGGLDGRVEARRLRAEVAVLGASARLGGEDALDLDFGAAPGEAHLMRQGRQGHDGAVGQRGQRGQLVTAQEAALVEECRLDSGDHRPVRRAQGDLGLGRGRRAVRRRGVAEGDGTRGGHGAHGSGRVGSPGS